MIISNKMRQQDCSCYFGSVIDDVDYFKDLDDVINKEINFM